MKTRRVNTSSTYAPIDAITGEKQQRIGKLSQIYVRAKTRALLKLSLRHIRYDVVGIVYRGPWCQPEIIHYPDAYRPELPLSLPTSRRALSARPALHPSNPVR